MHIQMSSAITMAITCLLYMYTHNSIVTLFIVMLVKGAVAGTTNLCPYTCSTVHIVTWNVSKNSTICLTFPWKSSWCHPFCISENLSRVWTVLDIRECQLPSVTLGLKECCSLSKLSSRWELCTKSNEQLALSSASNLRFQLPPKSSFCYKVLSGIGQGWKDARITCPCNNPLMMDFPFANN